MQVNLNFAIDLSEIYDFGKMVCDRIESKGLDVTVDDGGKTVSETKAEAKDSFLRMAFFWSNLLKTLGGSPSAGLKILHAAECAALGWIKAHQRQYPGVSDSKALESFHEEMLK